MRRSNRGRSARVAAPVIAAVLIAACGASAAPSVLPTARPTPVVTANPHLAAPASVDDLFRELGSAGIAITPNTATGFPGDDPVKRINATYADWPLALTEYTSAEALQALTEFDPKRVPAQGEAPYILAAMNLLIEYGPPVTDTDERDAPDDAHRSAFLALVAAADPLVGPLRQRAVDPVPLPAATPATGGSAAPASGAP